MLAVPREVASRPALVAPYPDWIMNMPEPQRTIAMRNSDAVAAYVPAAFGGRATIFVSTDLIRNAKRAGKYERTLGWKRLARGGVARHVIRGDHGTVLSPESWSYIYGIVRENIDRSIRDDGTAGQ